MDVSLRDSPLIDDVSDADDGQVRQLRDAGHQSVSAVVTRQSAVNSARYDRRLSDSVSRFRLSHTVLAPFLSVDDYITSYNSDKV